MGSPLVSHTAQLTRRKERSIVVTAVQSAVDNDFYTYPSNLGHVHNQLVVRVCFNMAEDLAENC